MNISKEKRPKFKRSILSILFLKPSMQFKYISIVFFAILIVGCLIGIHFWHTVVNYIVTDLGYAELYKPLMERNIIMVSFFLIYAVLVLVFAILISHKFAGPIYRFEKTFETLAQGNFSGFTALRKDDELFEMQDRINVMITGIQGILKKETGKITAITAKLDEIINMLHTGSVSGDAIKQCKDRLTQIKADISSINNSFTI
ncbi:MAG: methyl-accepting chemotaxis protein [bacterium]